MQDNCLCMRPIWAASDSPAANARPMKRLPQVRRDTAPPIGGALIALHQLQHVMPITAGSTSCAGDHGCQRVSCCQCAPAEVADTCQAWHCAALRAHNSCSASPHRSGASPGGRQGNIRTCAGVQCWKGKTCRQSAPAGASHACEARHRTAHGRTFLRSPAACQNFSTPLPECMLTWRATQLPRAASATPLPMDACWSA